MWDTQLAQNRIAHAQSKILYKRESFWLSALTPDINRKLLSLYCRPTGNCVCSTHTHTPHAHITGASSSWRWSTQKQRTANLHPRGANEVIPTSWRQLCALVRWIVSARNACMCTRSDITQQLKHTHPTIHTKKAQQTTRVIFLMRCSAVRSREGTLNASRLRTPTRKVINDRWRSAIITNVKPSAGRVLKKRTPRPHTHTT